MSAEPNTMQIPPPKDWQDFERRLCELLEAHWGARAEMHGRTGQAQHGVDIYGQPDGNDYHGVQCKGHDGDLGSAVTEKELTDEIKKATKFNPRLAHFILATTGPRDAKIQAVVRRLNERKTKPFTVEVMFWDDILTLYGQHRDVFARPFPPCLVAPLPRCLRPSVPLLASRYHVLPATARQFPPHLPARLAPHAFSRHPSFVGSRAWRWGAPCADVRQAQSARETLGLDANHGPDLDHVADVRKPNRSSSWCDRRDQRLLYRRTTWART
jgi:hypothetical protein